MSAFEDFMIDKAVKDDSRISELKERYNKALETIASVAKERDEALASCAAMREELEFLLQEIQVCDSNNVNSIINELIRRLPGFKGLSTDCGKAFLSRMKELELIAASVEEDPTIKYFAEQLGAPGEHSTCEAVDNIVLKLRNLQERVNEAEWLLHQPILAKMNDQSALTDWHNRRDAWLKGGEK